MGDPLLSDEARADLQPQSLKFLAFDVQPGEMILPSVHVLWALHNWGDFVFEEANAVNLLVFLLVDEFESTPNIQKTQEKENTF